MGTRRKIQLMTKKSLRITREVLLRHDYLLFINYYQFLESNDVLPYFCLCIISRGHVQIRKAYCIASLFMCITFFSFQNHTATSPQRKVQKLQNGKVSES